MKLKVSPIVLCLIASAGFLAAAPPAGAAEVLVGPLQISAVITNPQGGFLLLATATQPGCGPSGNQFNAWVGASYMTADGMKGALAVVLAAYAMGKPIKFYYNNALTGCPITQVWLEP